MKLDGITLLDIALIDLWSKCGNDWDRAIESAMAQEFPRDAVYMAWLRAWNVVHPGDLDRGCFPMPYNIGEALPSADGGLITHAEMLELMRRRGVPEELIASYNQAHLDSIVE